MSSKSFEICLVNKDHEIRFQLAWFTIFENLFCIKEAAIKKKIMFVIQSKRISSYFQTAQHY
ncbi:unnamed protein product (macronuclear) [Paramecium tetraurelia]|uniref:Uncharacterized protein n=1 Tax=Paramecium tetraurelia TaxID=5888 RepID=A0E8T4_PARTE|nr:uncharacterized protein GSPATT00024431001 [Paramecium tetraurelia]CAK91701.1 unnamed protein product [Paramecium tetraurelia]|eukprot:XP_001459098.1 hypothetical protein (macronuclear) [Paramecium tetraurelia strain d4-2]